MHQSLNKHLFLFHLRVDCYVSNNKTIDLKLFQEPYFISKCYHLIFSRQLNIQSIERLMLQNHELVCRIWMEFYSCIFTAFSW